jgi:hypothetical protein
MGKLQLDMTVPPLREKSVLTPICWADRGKANTHIIRYSVMGI